MGCGACREVRSFCVELGVSLSGMSEPAEKAPRSEKLGPRQRVVSGLFPIGMGTIIGKNLQAPGGVCHIRPIIFIEARRPLKLSAIDV